MPLSGQASGDLCPGPLTRRALHFGESLLKFSNSLSCGLEPAEAGNARTPRPHFSDSDSSNFAVYWVTRCPKIDLYLCGHLRAPWLNPVIQG